MSAAASRAKGAIWLAVALGLAFFAAANAHLLYVAVTSQPDCVAHRVAGSGAPGQYRAAKSSCTPRGGEAERQ